MKLIKYTVIKLSSYDSDNSYRGWYKLQPQHNNENIYINMENTNESNR